MKVTPAGTLVEYCRKPVSITPLEFSSQIITAAYHPSLPSLVYDHGAEKAGGMYPAHAPRLTTSSLIMHHTSTLVAG